jgi:hypothetical protein
VKAGPVASGHLKKKFFLLTKGLKRPKRKETEPKIQQRKLNLFFKLTIKTHIKSKNTIKLLKLNFDVQNAPPSTASNI